MLAQLTTWIKFLTPVLTLGMMVFYLDREKYPDVEQKERFKLMSGRD